MHHTRKRPKPETPSGARPEARPQAPSRLGSVRDRRARAIRRRVRSIGGERRELSRKQIQQAVTDWFEVSNSQITRALRAMARPPLGLIQIVEDPKSGREKQVLLTPKGERFLLTLVERGRAFFHPLGERLAPKLIRDGLVFLRQASAILGDAKSTGRFDPRRK
ncbi:MAG: winged helix DNA-binding protein [Candidatus Binataceae bacterium]